MPPKRNGRVIHRDYKPPKPKQVTRTTRTVNEHGVRVTVTTRRADRTDIRSTYKQHPPRKPGIEDLLVECFKKPTTIENLIAGLFR